MYPAIEPMRLLAGPPGSGKTTTVLREARSRIERGAADFRLVVPSSTMAEHLRNALARDGVVVRPSTIVTLSGLVAGLTPAVVEIGGEELALLVSECLAESQGPGAFAALRETPGLARSIAQNIEDLANSGCGPLQWAALGQMGVWRGAVPEAFGEVWERVEQRLAGGGFSLRAGRIAAAAAAVRNGALGGGISRILVDGFFTFSRVEIELLRALDRHTDLVVTLPEWAGAVQARTLLEKQGCRVEQFRVRRANPDRSLVAAVDPQREAEEIALRVLERRRDGFAWRDIGVIMRAEFPYRPLVERAFARADIPVRFYFSTPLAGTSVFRFFDRWMAALLSGWEHRLTLSALLALPDAADPASAAALERVVVTGLPGAGLDTLIRRAGAVAAPGIERLRARIESWKPFSGWVAEAVAPGEWAKRIMTLGTQVAAPVPEEASARRQLDSARVRASALSSVGQALDSAAALFAASEVTLQTFWQTASRVLAAAEIRPRDTRRDVVHVMDVYEARQWELPVVFVCGLVEGQFPRRCAPEPLFGDALRFQLQQQGFPVLTSRDNDLQESFLCEFAQTRAVAALTLTYPLHASDGVPLLRAFVLDSLNAAPAAARRMNVVPAAPVRPARRYSLQEPRVLDGIRAANTSFRPTALEDYLQCPFRFFARRTLRLRDPAEAPEERLNPLRLGTIIHEAINRWHKDGGRQDLTRVLDEEWRRTLAEQRIPPSWKAETDRLLLERSVRSYAVKGATPPEWETATEIDLELTAGDFRFAGRADRVDRNSTGQARVLEFKFVGAAGLKRRKEKLGQGLAIQAPLYARALEQRGFEPVAYSIVGLRGDTALVTCDQPEDVRAGMELAAARAAEAAFQITQGDIRVMPADPDVCSYCQYRDACRKREEAVVPSQAEEVAANS